MTNSRFGVMMVVRSRRSLVTEKHNINDIILYVQNRIDTLNSEGRESDLIAISEEFYEWLNSDDVSVITVKILENDEQSA